MSHKPGAATSRAVAQRGCSPGRLYRSINSMLGVLSHFDAYRLSRELFCVEPFLRHGYFSDDMTCYYLRRTQ